MRLLESEDYRGRQIRVYLIYPDGLSRVSVPSLGVRIDGQVVENRAFLQGIFVLQEALTWGRRAVDRVAGAEPHREPLLPAPV